MAKPKEVKIRRQPSKRILYLLLGLIGLSLKARLGGRNIHVTTLVELRLHVLDAPSHLVDESQFRVPADTRPQMDLFDLPQAV